MLQLEDFVKGFLKMVRLGKRKTTSGENYFITIPLTIIQALGWDKGTDLLVTKQEDKVIIEKILRKE